MCSQNLNSLNLSTSNQERFKRKLTSVVSQNMDYVFLQDIRGNFDTRSDNLIKIENFLNNNAFCRYNLHINANLDNRGTAILIKSSINYEVIDQFRDIENNYILILIKIDAKEYLLGSIYGPNHDSEADRAWYKKLFETIHDIKRRRHLLTILVAGDFNTILSELQVYNPDLIDSSSISQRGNQTIIKDSMNKIGLFDPFRLLFPDKIAFTWQNFGKTGPKKRLDFFLFSDNISNKILDCSISNGTLDSNMDHSCIYAKIGKKTIPPDFSTIYGNTICDPLASFIFKKTLLDTHINHSNDVLPRYMHLVSEMESFINNIKLENYKCIKRGDTELVDYEATIINFWNESAIHFPTSEEINNISINCNYRTFFEILMGSIKNALFAHQIFLEKRNDLINRNFKEKIQLATDIGDADLFEIFLKKAEDFNRKLLEKKIEHLNTFEGMHNERISPLFLNIQKAKSKEKNLSRICYDSGKNFCSKKDRYNFILKKFQCKFTLRGNRSSVKQIHRFLHKIDIRVLEKRKLNAFERDELDSPITFEEMELAAKQLNKKSSGGIDGFTTYFLLHFWNSLKHILFRFYNQCINDNDLSTSLKIARCKLIEKKGDLSEFKNWRSISVLSVFYKLYSKMLANRLFRVVEKVTGREQRGYKSSQTSHELVLNLLSHIEFLNKEKIKSGVLCIDFSSAFDYLSHDYISHVLEYFGFGPFFRKLIQIDMKDRSSTVYDDNNKVVGSFKAPVGTIQGGLTSPLIFIIALAPFLIRLGHDKNIRRPPSPLGGRGGLLKKECFTPLHMQAPVDNIDTQSIDYLSDINFAEGYADDITQIILLTLRNVKYILKLTKDFENISGLEINISKTSLTPLNSNDHNIVLDVERLGLKVTNKFKVLGFLIDKDLEHLEKNWDKVITKMIKQVQHWDRLFLSLKGRIRVAKTFLLSQLTHFAIILTPSIEKIEIMEKLIYDFIIGRDKVARNLIFEKPKARGIGYFNIRNFIKGVQIGFATRCCRFQKDIWKVLLKGDLHIEMRNKYTPLSRVIGPLLNNVSDYVKFSNLQKGSWKQKYIFLPSIDELYYNLSSNKEWWLNNQIRGSNNLICWSDLSFGNSFEPFDTCRIVIQNHTGHDLRRFEYFCLRNLFEKMCRKFGHCENIFSIEQIFNQHKSGSRKFRKIFDYQTQKKSKINNDKVVKNLLTSIHLDVNHVPLESLQFSYQIWLRDNFDNTLSTFIYKFLNNKLMTNDRKVHFGKAELSYCSFCVKNYWKIQQIKLGGGRGPITLKKEKYFHLFFECTIVQQYWEIYFPNVRCTDRPNLLFNNNVGHYIMAFIIMRTIFLIKDKSFTPNIYTFKRYILYQLNKQRYGFDNDFLRIMTYISKN